MTFGFFKPAVLLPANFDELEAVVQEAILCHEVLHVRRKDWLWTVAEELVRCAFWFHPAIWWLLGEIGLAREQVVDREVVEMTRSRASMWMHSWRSRAQPRNSTWPRRRSSCASGI